MNYGLIWKITTSIPYSNKKTNGQNLEFIFTTIFYYYF